MTPTETPTSKPRPAVPGARELAAFAVIAEQCALTQPQLARLLGRSEHTARWLRARWQRAGWVEGRVLLHGSPPFLWLTAKGEQIAASEFKPWRPQAIARLPHLAAVTDVRLHVAGRRPEATWISERVLARERALRNERRAHLPDAEVLIGEQRVAVEVELTQKERRRTEAIVAELCALYDAVWYFAPSGPRRQLEKLAARPGFERVQVLPLDDHRSGHEA